MVDSILFVLGPTLGKPEVTASKSLVRWIKKRTKKE